MFRPRNLFILVLIAAGFTSAFLSGYFLNAYFIDSKPIFSILDQAYGIMINHAYVDLPEQSELEYGMIRGMLQASGDPQASFHEPVQHELASNNLQGRYGGIGVELSRTGHGDVLVYPIIDSSASQAGILNNDKLVSVDGLVVTAEVSIDDIKAELRGPLGSWLNLVVSREPDFTIHEFRIKREEIHLPSVTWRTIQNYPSIGLINVNIIAETTPNEIRNAIEALQGAGANSFILDLRNNGGGLLTAGVDSAKLFLNDGIILQQQYRGEEVETFSTRSPGPLTDVPLVVLINRNTASAAEIIAGALQIHSRAQLIGESTFGKDTIQLIFDLDDGSSLHITAAKWWIPGIDPPLSEGGLEPDIRITQDESDVDYFLEAAIRSLMDG
jgi:carboxyl-terminal processing protease